jgi:putative ABC transport system permease protein
MRTVFDIFAQIFRNLWAHKLRSFLTMFGIAWGVGSLLLLVGVGEGFRSGNKRELAEFARRRRTSATPALCFLAPTCIK